MRSNGDGVGWRKELIKGMHATVWLSRAGSRHQEDLGQLGHRIGTRLSRSPSFVACLLVEAEDGVLATVSIFEDRASLEAANRLVEELLAERTDVVRSEHPPAITGEIVYQRGM